MDKKHIIVVDDETGIRQLVKTFLERHHYHVHEAGTGAEFFEVFKSITPDLIVLDLMLPDMYGIDICKKIRETSQVPVIMLTAVQGETNTVLGFEAGADDYVEKPFSAHVLLSRIQAILKRQQTPTVQEGTVSAKKHYQKATFGPWSYHKDEQVLKHLGGKHIFLTKGEAQLLELFVENENTILTREQLMEAMGLDSDDVESRAIDVQISRLRNKLKDKTQTNLIQSIRNKGYLLAVPIRLS